MEWNENERDLLFILGMGMNGHFIPLWRSFLLERASSWWPTMSQEAKTCGCSEVHCTCVYCGYTFATAQAAADHEQRRFHPGRHWVPQLPRRAHAEIAHAHEFVRGDSDAEDDNVVASDDESVDELQQEQNDDNGDDDVNVEGGRNVPIENVRLMFYYVC